MKKYKYIMLYAIAIALLFNGCSLDTEPTNAISDKLVYNNISLLEGVLNSTYSKLKNEVPGHGTEWSTYLKLMSTSYGWDINVTMNQKYGNTAPFKSASFYEVDSYIPTEYASRGIWQVLYRIIYNTNTILDNIDAVNAQQEKKDNIKGQALIMRARCYFDLIRVYQHTYAIAKDKLGVPLRLTAETKEDIPRETVENVYKQILEDLLQAEKLLANFEREDISYYNIDVARFLLANVYLTMNNWSQAEAYANKIRVKYPLMSIEKYQDGFTTINDEWVLGYKQTEQDYTPYTLAAYYDFGQSNIVPMYSMYPSNYFVETVMSGDPRSSFIAHPTMKGKYALTKFFDHNESLPYGDLIDMRAAEMYLVEAEAAARQGKNTLALSILNLLQKSRPGAVVTTTTNQSELIDAILLERRKEMYGEGLDYWDIKRLQSPVKKSIAHGNELDLDLPANTNILTLMIPDQEMLNNKAMVQNPNPSVTPVYIP
jgi:starch-binding outer membrane protein, SusD/RagB family